MYFYVSFRLNYANYDTNLLRLMLFGDFVGVKEKVVAWLRFDSGNIVVVCFSGVLIILRNNNANEKVLYEIRNKHLSSEEFPNQPES